MKKNTREENFIKNMAHISHEIQTPVNLIAATAKLIELITEKDGTNIERIKEYSGNIINNCNKLSMMLTNILESNHANLSAPVLVNTKQFFDEFCSNTQIYLNQLKVTLKPDFKCTKEIISIPVNTIERILLNLITNSVKYGNDKNTVISLEMFTKNNSLFFTVKDNGTGISEENIPRLTEPFFRVDNTVPKGFGLGLSLVKEYITLLNGTLDIKSELNKGTEITFSVPLTDDIPLSTDEHNLLYIAEKANFDIEFAQFKNDNF